MRLETGEADWGKPLGQKAVTAANGPPWVVLNYDRNDGQLPPPLLPDQGNWPPVVAVIVVEDFCV